MKMLSTIFPSTLQKNPPSGPASHSRMCKKSFLVVLFLSAFLTAALLLSRSCLPGTDTNSADEAFEAFTNGLFRESVTGSTLTLHYTLADPASYGIRKFPISYGSYSEEAKARSAAALENAFAALSDFPRSKLSYENRLTYDILDTQIPRELTLLHFPYYEEVCSPLLGVQAQLPVLLAEYAFDSEADVDVYLRLLAKTDAYFEELCEYEKKKAAAGLFMTDESADAVIAGCQDFLNGTQFNNANQSNRNQNKPENIAATDIDSVQSSNEILDTPEEGSEAIIEHFLAASFSERLTELSQRTRLSDRQTLYYVNLNQRALESHVFPAYAHLIENLSSLKGSGTNPWGLAHYPEGRAYYQALVDAVVGSGRTLPEIRDLIDRQLLSDVRQMAELVKRRPELLTDISRTIEVQEPEQILEELQTRMQTDFPAAAIYAHNGADADGTDHAIHISVKSVSPSLQEHLSPAFYLTPPLDAMWNHVIYINPAADYDGLTLFTTLAHEGFPGHLYQTLSEQTPPQSPVRSLFYFGGFVEGWATYAERLSYRYAGLDPDMADLLAANSFFLLGLYARSDVGIHYEGWTPSEMNQFWNGYSVTDSAVLAEIYQTIQQDPANYLKDYLGAVEILELRKEVEELMGTQFSLKDFHRFLLVTGPAPFSVLRSILKESVPRT